MGGRGWAWAALLGAVAAALVPLLYLEGLPGARPQFAAGDPGPADARATLERVAALGRLGWWRMSCTCRSGTPGELPPCCRAGRDG